MDLAALEAAGLYDPDDPRAPERRALLEYLVGQGCTVEEMVAADANGRLFGLAGDRIIRPGRDQLTLRELAERAGADVGLVGRLWQAYGFPIAAADARVASPDDLAILPPFLAVAALLGEDVALGLARVAGASIARFAEALSASVRGTIPELTTEMSADEVTTARTYAGLASLVPAAGRALDVLLRHHLDAARRHFELSESYDVAQRGQVRLGVGFADLSGFTALSETATSAQLSELLTRFEEVTTEVVHRHDGRVVKFIGDAVMYVTPRAGTAVDVAVSLVERLATDGGPGVRAGVTYGVLLAQDGDYYGPPVNLAARLVAAADAGQVLVSGDVAERLAGEREVAALPARELRGLAEPVVPYVVR